MNTLPGLELMTTSLWGLVLVAACVGWGHLVVRLVRPTYAPSSALRAVWGAGAFTFVGGLLALVSLAFRPVLGALVVAGAAYAAYLAFRERVPRLRRGRAFVRLARRSPGVLLLLAAVGFLLAVSYLGAASDVTSNPYDDDTAYFPFAKQLAERGTLVDPFSFRRLSTLGGTALFHAALLVGVGIQHLNVFDRGVCLLLVVWLLMSARVGGARVPLFARAAGVVFVVTLPSASINTGSYHSGALFFLAFFQTFEAWRGARSRGPTESVRKELLDVVPLGLLGAALATLRQNYQATVATFLLFALLVGLLKRRPPGATRRFVREHVLVGLAVGVCVLPWLLLLYRSSDTFLFPLMKGTYRVGAAMTSSAFNWARSIQFFVDTLVHPEPLGVLPLFALVGLSMPDPSRQHLRVVEWIAGLASVYLICVAFSLSDASNVMRYNYAFLIAAVLLTWHAVTARVRELSIDRALRIGFMICGFGASFVMHAPKAKKQLSDAVRDIDELTRRTITPQADPPVAAAYRRLQGLVPPGQRLLVMVDDPFRFDFRRNEVWNLDTPGLASPAPGIPCFHGAEPVAEYLLAKGIRYVALVESSRSVYLYRREIWAEHLFGPNELLRETAPYVLDTLENFRDLAASRAHLGEEAGMVVLDLSARRPKEANEANP